MSDDLRARILEALVTAPRVVIRDDLEAAVRHAGLPVRRHDRHGFDPCCALCCGEAETLADAVMAALGGRCVMRSKLADAQLRERVECAVARVMDPSPECAVVVESVMTALVGVPGLAATVGAQVHMNRALPSPDELLALRTRQGLSRQQVADVVGVTREAVAQWERGVCSPMRGTTERLRYLNLVDLLIQQTREANA